MPVAEWRQRQWEDDLCETSVFPTRQWKAARSLRVVRNERGETGDEIWNELDLRPCYFAIDNARTLQAIVDETSPKLLGHESKNITSGLAIVFDSIGNAGDQASPLLSSLVSKVLGVGNNNHRILLLAESGAAEDTELPPSVVRHNLSPTLESQRRAKMHELARDQIESVHIGLGPAAQDPIIFALALQSGKEGLHAETVLDAWLSKIVQSEKQTRLLEEYALRQVTEHPEFSWTCHTPRTGECAGNLFLAATRKVQHLLAARLLAKRSARITADLFHREALPTIGIVRSVLVRLEHSVGFDVHASALLEGAGTAAHHAALIASRLCLFVNLVARASGRRGSFPDRNRLPTFRRPSAGCMCFVPFQRPDEEVRLPTESEWDSPDPGAQIYPWGPSWCNESASSEDVGFNQTCSVGLFLKSQSQYGCQDMAGNIWKWCSTLWGEDMTTPDFQYQGATMNEKIWKLP